MSMIHGKVVLETVWILCDEAREVGCPQRLEDYLLVHNASIQLRFTRYHWRQDQWDGYELCRTRQGCSTQLFNGPGL